MNYSSVFIVYMAVFESPSILLFNEKVVSHWLLFYARKSFHLPSLIAVEFTKFSCYCANILPTHLLYLSSRACKCMLIFQPGGVLCWLKDAKCHRQLSTLDLLWPALSPDPQRNLVSSFQMQIFFYPFLCWLWINADHLHSWTAGQATPAVYVILQTLHLHTALLLVDPHCFVRRRYQNFPTLQAGQECQRHLAAVRLADQLAAPHAHLERAGPCTGC